MDSFGVTEGLLSATDAERLVKQLRPFGIVDICTPPWLAQHASVEQLNLQAHHSAMIQAEEFVKESLVAHDKLPVLVEELLAAELWRAAVWPLVRPRLLPDMPAGGLLKPHLVARHEGALVNLLEVLLFHADALMALGDSLLELLDYAFRKLSWLGDNLPEVQARMFEASSAASSSSSSSTAAAAADELAERWMRVDFNATLNTISVISMAAEHIGQLPLAVVNKLIKDNDMPCALAAFILASPWRRKDRGKTYTYDVSRQRWSPLEASEMARVHLTEAHSWMALNNLLLDDACRNKYFISTRTKPLLLKLKPLLLESLIDQIPPLRDLQRFLENLTMFDPPAPTDKASVFLIEQVPEIRQRLQRTNWQQAAEIQLPILLAEMHKTDEISRLAEAFSFSGIQDLLDKPKCAKCGQPAPKRCSRCKNEWYCCEDHQRASWKNHKPICDMISKDSAKQSAAAPK
eukprot:TRINITY_DN9884_c0_g2_i1.p1 TRINITY_DN9884_c0_g2~~TRINITY_DN9884_c0_g2_i1.p1  ORF type:complete len:462 (+),score=201.48 TRINITY_DN9884_c0_g2_i1:172-1557(+)